VVNEIIVVKNNTLSLLYYDVSNLNEKDHFDKLSHPAMLYSQY